MKQTLYLLLPLSLHFESRHQENYLILSPKVAPPSFEALNITSQLPDLLVHHTMYTLFSPATAIGAFGSAIKLVLLLVNASADAERRAKVAIIVVIAPATTIVAT